MPYHGVANRYVTNGASTLATLYATASTATTNPALTVRNVGSAGGQAAAFTFDVARSVVYSRQGNPAWEGQERDGTAPIRPDDLFFGGALPDWNDMTKVAIPHADELQRVLANLIGYVNADRKPMPRFWYFPRGEKAVVVMTGDDHGNGGTGAASTASGPRAQRAARWPSGTACAAAPTSTRARRSRTRPLPHTSRTASRSACTSTPAAPTTRRRRCRPFTPTSSPAGRASTRACRPPSRTEPTASPGATGPLNRRLSSKRDQVGHELLLLAARVGGERAGFFPGSGMPMRFADLDGTMIDVYQAVTQMTDESGQRIRRPSTRCSTAPSGRPGTTARSPRTCTRTMPTRLALTPSLRPP